MIEAKRGVKMNRTQLKVEKISKLGKERLACENIFQENHGEQGFLFHKEALQCCDEIIVLKQADEVLGYAALQLDSNIVTCYDTLWVPKVLYGIYLDQVALKKKYQGMGLANMLYEYIKVNADKLYAHVSIENEPSMKFHVKQGFVPIGDFICDNFYGYLNYRSILLEYAKK